MILNRQRAVRVAQQPLEKFLHRVQDELGLHDSDLVVCLVSDTEMARMNQRYRGKRGPTDVLSFPSKSQGRIARGQRLARKKSSPDASSPASRQEHSYVGDIAIAPETARRYAKKGGRSLASELRVLVLHGVLHLLGYDHETDTGQMARFEQKLRRRFGLR
jgi:probable rRNA maturation factor